jgi:hypothetical protein
VSPQEAATVQFVLPTVNSVRDPVNVTNQRRPTLSLPNKGTGTSTYPLQRSTNAAKPAPYLHPITI